MALGSARFGSALAWLGDYDGDGLGELVVGEFLRGGAGVPNPTNSGESGLSALIPAESLAKPFPWNGTRPTLRRSPPRTDFGFSVANLGDWDGDGAPEIGVGALFDGDGGSENGAVYILYLDANPLASAIKSFLKISDTAGSFDGGFDPPTWFGASISPVGDLDGNGQIDLAIGARKRGSKGAAWVALMDVGCQTDAASCACCRVPSS